MKRDKFYLIIGDYLAKASFGDKTFPDAAFVVERGAEKDENGQSLQKYRHLPHHTKSVKSSTEHGTVDLPHLRNALARVGQVKPTKEATSKYRRRAKSHLNAHANALLKSRNGNIDFDQIEALFKEFDIPLEKGDNHGFN